MLELGGGHRKDGHGCEVRASHVCVCMYCMCATVAYPPLTALTFLSVNDTMKGLSFNLHALSVCGSMCSSQWRRT